MTKTLERSASVHLLFSFEYVIQVSIVMSAFIKYTLGVVDGYFEGRWENKVQRATQLVSHTTSEKKFLSFGRRSLQFAPVQSRARC